MPMGKGYGKLKDIGKAMLRKLNIGKKKKKATKPGAVDDNARKRQADRKRKQRMMIEKINRK